MKRNQQYLSQVHGLILELSVTKIFSLLRVIYLNQKSILAYGGKYPVCICMTCGKRVQANKHCKGKHSQSRVKIVVIVRHISERAALDEVRP